MLLLAPARPVGTGLSTGSGIISINTADTLTRQLAAYQTVMPTGDRPVEAPAVHQAPVPVEKQTCVADNGFTSQQNTCVTVNII